MFTCASGQDDVNVYDGRVGLTVGDGRDQSVDRHRAVEDHAFAERLLAHEIASVVGESAPVFTRTRWRTSERVRQTSVLRSRYRRGHLSETSFVGMKPVLPWNAGRA